MESIGRGAFNTCSLPSLTLPASVTEVGGAAFYYSYIDSFAVAAGNPAYTEVDGVLYTMGMDTLVASPVSRRGSFSVPSSVTRIEDYALATNGGMTEILIPDSVTFIGEGALSECYGLQHVSLPSGLTQIADELFFASSQLESVRIPAGVTSVGSFAFLCCDSLRDIWFAGTRAQWDAVSIGQDNGPLAAAEIHCLPTAVLTLPADLAAIESEAFTGLPNVEGIRIPDGVVYIAPDAFDPGMTLLVPAGSPWAQWAAENGYGVFEE